MAKIKLNLKTSPSGQLVLQILEMDESLRGNASDFNRKFTASNGYEIDAYSHPEINLNILYLRGYKREQDKFTFYRNFGTFECAQNQISKLKFALREFISEKFA